MPKRVTFDETINHPTRKKKPELPPAEPLEIELILRDKFFAAQRAQKSCTTIAYERIKEAGLKFKSTARENLTKQNILIFSGFASCVLISYTQQLISSNNTLKY